MTDPIDLEGRLLIAMPGMPDPRFHQAVVLICSHTSEGALGLIVNKPTGQLDFAQLVSRMGIASGGSFRDMAVHFGGPVDETRGFVLHTSDHDFGDGTLTVGDFALTGTVDVLELIARGQGPERAILAIGYSGWGPGQLEDEIGANGWLLGDPDPDLVFGADDDGKWRAALEGIGVDPRMLSGTAGHA